MNNEPTFEALQRLGELVEQRRSALELRQDQLTHGPSTTTMTQIEAGKKVSTASYRKAEESLGWSKGSIDTILAGGEPSEMTLGDSLSKLVPTTMPGGWALEPGLFDRAERLVAHARRSATNRDVGAAVHGLEGLQSTVELLIARLIASVTDDEQNHGTLDAHRWPGYFTSTPGDQSSDDAQDGTVGLNRHRDGLREVQDPDHGDKQSG